MPGTPTPSKEYQGQEHDPTKKVPKQEDYEKEAEQENEPKEKQSRVEYESTPKYYKAPKTSYQKWREKKYEKSYTKEGEKLARAEARSKLEAIREARKAEIEAHPGKYREAGRTAIAGTQRFISSYGYGKARYRAEMGGSDKAGKPRTSKAEKFARKQQPKQAYRQMTSEPIELNPRRDYEFFGQPREYNLIGENKKYDLGFGTGKKHDLGVGKKYDLGIGSKKELDLFGNGNGKKKKNDKFW